LQHKKDYNRFIRGGAYAFLYTVRGAIKRRKAKGKKGNKKDKNKADKQKNNQTEKKKEQQKTKLPAKK